MEKDQIQKLRDEALQELIERVMLVDLVSIKDQYGWHSYYDCPYCGSGGDSMVEIKHDQDCTYQFAKEMKIKLEVLEKI